jgi:uncharacterized protein
MFMDKVVHFEVPADNMARAQEFYKNVFGWGMKDIPMPDGNAYTIVTTVETDENHMPKESGAINGGMMKRSPMNEGPVIVMQVDSLEETGKKIEAAGGSIIMPKTQIMDMGYYARAKDSEGNSVGIWEDIKKGT